MAVGCQHQADTKKKMSLHFEKTHTHERKSDGSSKLNLRLCVRAVAVKQMKVSTGGALQGAEQLCTDRYAPVDGARLPSIATQLQCVNMKTLA